MNPQKKLLLVDAYMLVFAAHYAFSRNPRFSSKKVNTSAIFGFLNSLDLAIKDNKPEYLAVVFDPSGPNFRHQMYPAYKANRQPTPEEIKIAVPYILEILKAKNIRVFQMEGYEADDVIGSLSKIAEKKDFEVVIVTSDKDYCQLVSDKIKIYKPKTSEIWGVEEVKKQFDIENPLQVIDVLTLWGDAVDNIKGIEGVGEVKSKKLIKTYGSVEKMFENLNDLKGKDKDNAIKAKDHIFLSKQLITIKIDIDLEFDEEQLTMKTPDWDMLKPLYEELEFRNMLEKQFPKSKVSGSSSIPYQKSLFDDDLIPAEENVSNFKSIHQVEHEYILVNSESEILSLVDLLLQNKEFCFDTETTGLEVHSSDLVGMSFCVQKGKAYFVPVPEKLEEVLPIVNLFKEVFENKEKLKIGQNVKFDLLVLKKYGIEVSEPFFDTMVAHYLLHPESPHNMDELSKTYLNYKPVSITELIGTDGKLKKTMRMVAKTSMKLLCDYAAEDADVTWQLKEILDPEIKKNNLSDLFFQIEMPLIPVLAEMEFHGIRLDGESLRSYRSALVEEILMLEESIKKHAGFDFNIASPKQLGEVLFERMKIIKSAKKTSKSKQYATGENELQKLVGLHPIIHDILHYRTSQKLLSTYIDALPALINSSTGRLHTSYNQTIVATGRLSSNNPNLQNIPIKDAKGREIRKAFIPSVEGRVFIDADYTQIELRLMAHFSQDPSMIEAFLRNEDIHTATAAKIFHIAPEEITKEMRNKAKSANFGIIYGISAFGLAENLNISRSEAKALIDGYFENFPNVKLYMDECIRLARENLVVETLCGRKRFLRDINSKDQVKRGMAERNAINAPIQGSAADIIKLAMVHIHKRLNEEGLKSKLVLQVHDELVFDTVLEEVDILSKIIRYEMENVVKLKVPLTVDLKTGKNWLEAH